MGGIPPSTATRRSMNKLLSLSVALLLGACSTSMALSESRRLADLGQYHRAFHALDRVRQAYLDDGDEVPEDLAVAWQAARIRHLVEKAREQVFLEKEDRALVLLAKVLAEEPAHGEALELRARALDKKLARILEDGDNCMRRQDLAGALAAFLAAERVRPGDVAARQGQAKVRAAYAKLEARAQAEFLEAARKLPEFRYVETQWHAANALANDPGREDAAELRLRARRELARQALRRGGELQAEGRFGAALVELRRARELGAASDEVDTGIAAVERELEARKLVDRAEMYMRRGEIDEARRGLDEAYEMSVMMRGNISELLIELRRTEGERDYQAARDFEVQGMKREALAAFVALAEDWPEGLSDEQAHIEGLQTDIAAAQSEWDLAVAAEEAGEIEQAIEHYEASQGAYARLADAEARLERLRAQRPSSEQSAE